MKLIIIDPIPWNYTPDTPYERAIGGTQSAICFFLEKMAILEPGSAILFNNCTEPDAYTDSGFQSKSGVIVYNIEKIYSQFSRLKPDIILVSCYIDIIQKMRGKLSQVFLGPLKDTDDAMVYKKCMWGVWTGHDIDQPINDSWKNPDNHILVDFYAFVSNWQRDRYLKTYPINPNKTLILRNGISTPFETEFLKNIGGTLESIRHKKKNIIAYTSVPFRGLQHFITIFPLIRTQVPDCILRIYSGMNTYFADENNYQSLYDELAKIDGVEIHPGISQKDLAVELADVKILAYPCTFAETSCISVLEAMSQGCYIVSSNIGALKESTGGNGLLIEDPDELTKKNYGGYYVGHFVDYIVKLLRNERVYPEKDNELLLLNGFSTIMKNNIYLHIVEKFRENVAKIIPKNANFLNNIDYINKLLNGGVADYQQKKYEPAIEKWGEILEISPNLENVYMNCILAAEESGNIIKTIHFGIDYINYMRHKYQGNIPENIQVQYRELYNKIVNHIAYRIFL
jgi:hypothetical protein